jgi:hypothetical protein
MKMEKLPSEMMRERRRLSSTIGPRTMARIRGAASYPKYLIMRPTIPKINITTTSPRLLFRLYDPMRQKRRIIGPK